MSYQPKWIDGKEVGTSKRPCAERYAAIAEYLQGRYGEEAPITVLDFGAQGGYFTARLAEDFNATITAVEANRQALAHLSRTPGIRVIAARLTPEQVAKLGHFDVVLGLSVLHHLRDWKEYLSALTGAGDVTFLEVANPKEALPLAVAHKDSGDIDEAVTALSSTEPLTYTQGYDADHARPLYVVDAMAGTPEALPFDPEPEPEPEPKPRPKTTKKKEPEDSVPDPELNELGDESLA